jgi:hypothetical protein
VLPGINGDESWELPPPATYVITEDRCVVLAYVDVDCRRRLAPEDIVAALHSLERRTAGRARAPMRPPLLTAAAIKGECILSAQALPCLGIFFTPFGVWARFVAFTPKLTEPVLFHQGNLQAL